MSENQSKFTTVSVRVEDDLLKNFDTTSTALDLNKSEFLRACIIKLCYDNKPLVEHCPKTREYIDYIKKEMSELPREMVEVINGSWDEVSDAVIVILCDALWKSADQVYNIWLEFGKPYNIKRKEIPSREEGLLDIASIAMLVASKLGSTNSNDLIARKTWIDQLEMDRISLLYSCKKAFEDTSTMVVVQSFIESESKIANKKMKICVDAKGSLKRSGSTLYLPVESIPVEDDTIE